ncbi:MAG: hypothetical protein JNL82_36365 [Myxococcales bacterium]|nr:hypothetical protein [Myxococcales bacterium]
MRDHNGTVVDHVGLSEEDVEPLMGELAERFGARAQILTNAPVRASGPLSVRPSASVRPAAGAGCDDDREVEELDLRSSVELMNHMMLQTFRQATQAHAWLMNQANAFTQQLIEGNRQLAEHANKLQRHYQDRLAEIDITLREQRLMEYEASSKRYSRHLIEKATAEAAASRPGRGGEVFDDLLDGIAAALETWARNHGDDGDHRRRG